MQPEKTPEHVTPEIAQLVAEMGRMMKKNDQRGLIVLRRKIRNRLFRIRDAIEQNKNPEKEHDSGLKAWMELQFQPDMTWYKKNEQGEIIGGFTFDWDVSAKEPLKLIIGFEWDGKVDTDKRCVPPAFTKQG